MPIIGNSSLSAIVAIGVLSGCAASSLDPVYFATTPEAVEAFESACLATLPDFAGFEAAVAELGMVPMPSFPGPGDAYVDPEKMLVAVSIVGDPSMEMTPDDRFCMVAADGAFDGSVHGRALLASARAATGGEGSTFPSSFFDIAEHLPNGSLITNDVRPKSYGARSMVSISRPVSRDQVPDYIYN